MRVREMVVLGLACLIVSACVPARCLAVIWNVPAEAPTIQAGIDSAVAGGDTVMVACGTYYEYNIAMRSGVYLTSETGEFGCVTIDAQQNGRVFYGSGLNKSTYIKGFTITGGQSTTDGGGLYLDSSSPRIINCHITGNRLTDWNERGVGMYMVWSSDPEITDCVFSSNLCLDPSNGFGGAAYMNQSCDPVFTNCTFYGNRAPYGCHVAVLNSSLPQFDNCIFADGLGGSAFNCAGGGVPTLTCCDVYGNQGGDWAGCISGMDLIDNNFSEPPLFCDPAYQDFHLRSCSPCLDADSCGLVGALGAGGCTNTWEVPEEISTIQAAIDTACSGDTVLVADGVYAENLVMKGGIHVLGASNDPRFLRVEPPVSGCVTVFSQLTETTYLEGFTLSGGSAVSGGGVYCYYASPEITNCRIVANHATTSGGGIRCAFSSSPVFTNCLIAGNVCDNEGGGCSAEHGAWPSFINCTFFGNGAPTGGGLYIESSTVDLMNSIIAFGSEGFWFDGDMGAVIIHSCSNIYGNPGGDLPIPLSVDPQFCDTSSYDFHLASDSPCLLHECGLIGAYGRGCLGERPVIRDAGDVGNDQGRSLRLTWERNKYDAPGGAVEITSYEVYRRQDANLLDGHGEPVKMLGSPGPDPLLAGWDYLATVPAHGESLYQYVAPTLCDSTLYEGICWSVFFIRAATPDPFEYFDSPVDSGYSIDNLAPGPPPGLMFSNPSLIVWEEVADEDLFHYAVYGSDQPELDGSAVLITETPRLLAPVPGHAFDYFHVTAVDFSGNEGDESSVANAYAGIEPENRPAVNALMQNRPNPFEAKTLIRFDLARPGKVKLAVYDVGGELVRTLTDESWPAGRHSLNWTGDDARGNESGPGIYFLRMEAVGFKATRKVIILR